ncbi:MAG: hypothetical protein IJP26_04780 [Clostridia bacterium]|nr:hypothetical protein [Clostridia bacterium]
MFKIKTTKKALLASALSLILCLAMLLGSTYAWFTDNVTTAGNIIQSGTLNVDLVDVDGKSMEGKVIEFVTDGRAQSEIFWEPGCTYKTEPVFVANKGNLAFKYKVGINGINGDTKLLEVIEWTVKIGDAEYALSSLQGELLAGQKSEAIVLSGHMKEEAGNEYQGLTVEGISITVFATQLTSEVDSFSDQYDAMATVDTVDELKAALEEKSVKIVLGADIALAEGIVIAADQEVAIDLAGYTLSHSVACTKSYNMITNNGSLTIEDCVGTGKISFSDTGAGDPNVGWASYTINNSGTLTINGGTIEHLGTQTYNANNAIFNYTGKTTINAGVISAPYSRSLRIWNGEATINGGSFDGQVWAQPVKAEGCKLTINGGSFKPATYGNDGSSVYVTNDTYPVEVSVTGGNLATKLGMKTAVKCVTGGTFGVDPSNFVAVGYKAVLVGDRYEVIKYATVASTAVEMENALKNGENVVLTDDIELTGTLMTDKDVVIDLNGKTVTTSSNCMFQSQSNAASDITITSSTAGAEISISGGDTSVLLGYGKTEINNVTINVTGCDNSSPNPFKVYGDLTIGEGTVVNVDYLGTSLINNNGAVNIVIDGAKINVGTFKTNGTAIISLNQASILELKNTNVKIDNFVLSAFGGDSLVSKADGVTIEGCTFDVTDSNGASCTFEAKDGKYRLVQK